MPRKSKDLLLVHGPTPDGSGVNVLRSRDERLEIGTMHPLAEGRPIHGEVVKLTPHADVPMLFEVETQVAAPAPRALAQDTEVKPAASSEARGTSAGPAQVASDTYRKNWDAIWKKSLN